MSIFALSLYFYLYLYKFNVNQIYNIYQKIKQLRLQKQLQCQSKPTKHNDILFKQLKVNSNLRNLSNLGFSVVLIFSGMELSIKLKAFSAKYYMISPTNIRIQFKHVMGNVVSLPDFKYFFH